VTVDLVGAMERPLVEAQSAIEERWELMDSTDWGMSGEEWKELRSDSHVSLVLISTCFVI